MQIGSLANGLALVDGDVLAYSDPANGVSLITVELVELIFADLMG